VRQSSLSHSTSYLIEFHAVRGLSLPYTMQPTKTQRLRSVDWWLRVTWIRACVQIYRHHDVTLSMQVSHTIGSRRKLHHSITTWWPRNWRNWYYLPQQCQHIQMCAVLDRHSYFLLNRWRMWQFYHLWQIKSIHLLRRLTTGALST